MEWAGTTAADKLTAIRRRLAAVHADGMLVSALDDIAWTLNLRGADIECNPVFIAYLLIASRGATLFTECIRVSDEVKEYLNDNGVELRPYNKIGEGLAQYFEYSILMDGNETAALMPRYVPSRTQVIYAPSPIPLMKAVKNEAETAGFRRAMVSDGVAMVRLLKWIKPAVAKGGVTEMGVDDKLTALRSEDPAYVEKSFETIAAYESHGAIVHYEAEPATAATVEARSLLLLDSGAQFDCGTTDITRTLSCGELTREEREVYTLVLKGHLALAALSFPEGTCGLQLDLAARSPLWKAGLDFGHGTGHGVGSHLCVHEGPHQIRKNPRACTQVPFVEGMTITDEPGVYVAGKFGVRIVNILLTVFDRETEFGRFLRFETLTLCPYDLSALAPDLLTVEEVAQLNAYHARVRSLLLPRLTDEADRDWLVRATQPLVP